MPKTSFVDFKCIKSALTMEQVLEHYGVREQFKQSGDSLSGPCPIHGGSNPTQFRVSLSKNIWNCFSKCQRGGNALDFIARKEDITIHAAALKAIEWFDLDAEAVQGTSGDHKKSAAKRSGAPPSCEHVSQRKKPLKQEPTLNKPLKFTLDKLERSHPYLTERGLTAETIADFEIGYCSKGMMAGRIAIPIRNPAGFVVAYGGRFPGSPPDNTEKYKLPPEFKKSLELFNIDRALKAPPEDPLIIVEGFFGCIKLHQQGYRKVVALMGSSLSANQEELLKTHFVPGSRILIMLDEDETGQKARQEIAARLATFAFVKIHVFDEVGTQPEQLSSDELIQALGGEL